MTKDTWTAKHEEAVFLVAEDELTDLDIAAELGISKRTLEGWKRDTLFRERLKDVISEIHAALMQRGIARLDRRLARWNKTWHDLQAVIEARATEYRADYDVIGGETGLVVKNEKPGMFGTTVEISVDTGILAELRALEQQAAKELGQWVEKHDLTSGGKALPAGPDLRGLSAARLAELEQILMEADDASNSAHPARCEGGEVPA